MDREEALMAAGLVPLPSYLLADGTPMVPRDHLDPVGWAGGTHRLHDWFVAYWFIIFPLIFGSIYGFLEAWKRSLAVQVFMDKLMLRLPVFGHLVKISTIARWTRTLSTMFAAGVPLGTAITNFEDGVGSTLKEVGLLIALGAMLGKLLADSGGADRIVSTLIDKASA